MLCLSRVFVLSERGDTVVNKTYRDDVPKDSNEIFFRKMKFWINGDAPPVFNEDGVNYIWIKNSGLYFACTTKFNVSPTFTVELLLRLSKVFKDYCGVLTEESMRKNFVLIYELLDETMDYGYAQGTSTELLKACVHNTPIAVPSSANSSSSTSGVSMRRSSRTKPSTAANKSVLDNSRRGRKDKNDIFVDILERLNILVNSEGTILNSSIDGSIQMKSYLSGNPPLRLALNEDLAIGKSGNSYGSVVLDDATFHENANLDEFDDQKVINFISPDGEFSIMNYRVTKEYKPPIKIFAFVEVLNPKLLELTVKIRTDMPSNNYAGNVVVSFTVPRFAANVSPNIIPSDNSGKVDGKVAAVMHPYAEYNAKDLTVVWKMKKLPGNVETGLRTRISLTKPASSHIRKEIGPILLDFEIPMYNASHLQVKYLRIHPDHKSYTPQRWVRYITQSGSYVCRL